MNIAASASSEDKENMWILVDSDGEEVSHRSLLLKVVLVLSDELYM